MAELSVSVVVPTFNRAGDCLPGALDSLAAQTFPAERFEVIVVDNNSTDQTRLLTERFRAAHPALRVVYAFEPRQGLNFARNAGWRAASAPYVAFIDDDALAPHGWLGAIVAALDRHAPDVCGGPYRAYYRSAPPGWWRDEYLSMSHGDVARWLHDGEWLSGTNMVYRLELLEGMNGFPVDHLGPGDETKLQILARAAHPGLRVFYEPAAWVDHLAAPAKLSVRATLRISWRYGIRNPGTFLHDRARRRQARLRAPVRLARAATRAAWHVVGVCVRDRARYPAWQNYVFERVAPTVYELATQAAVLRDLLRGA